MSDDTTDTDQPAGDTSGPAPGPEIPTAAPEDTTGPEDTAAAFSDAFGPPANALALSGGGDDDGGFTADQYQALAEEFEDDSAEPEPGDLDSADTAEEPEPATNREARYRTRLRATEAERDALRGTVTALQRAEAVRLASTRLADPAGDLFRDHGIAEVLAEDGSVDPERVTALADSIIASHPHYGIPRPAVDPNGLRSGARKPDEAPPNNWQQAFAPAREV